jgi:hypothetical protein
MMSAFTHKGTRMLLTVVAAGALAAFPATGAGKDKPKHPNKGKGHTKRCGKAPKVGYVVDGTLVSITADNPLTAPFEGTVTLTVTGANAHARNSGEIADQNPTADGVQVAGATYTVPSSDPFTLKLNGFEGADTPSPGDGVHVVGKIARTKAKCAAPGTSLADRYATPNVKTVTITDRDPDA